MAKSRLILLTVVLAGTFVTHQANSAPENIDPEFSYGISGQAHDALDALLKKAN